jgi:ribonuclease HII
LLLIVRLMGKMLIGGIDEAGRGPLAGPIAVGLVVAPKGFRFWTQKLGKIRDSKQLSAKKREEWFSYLRGHPELVCRCAFVAPGVIDRINIYQAALRAAARLYRNCKPSPHFVWLDGSLGLPLPIPHRVVIRGDERIPVVAAASIIAKVSRDRYMVRMAKKYPAYNFERHKGYGSRLHIETIKQVGPSPIHRESFIKSFV